MSFRDAILKEAHLTATTNGAMVYDTSFNSNVDLFGSIGSMRHNYESENILLFENAFKENPVMATRLLFYARDCRGGYGERKVVFDIFKKSFMDDHPEYGVQLVKHFAEYGRWKDMWDLIDLKVKEVGIEKAIEDKVVVEMLDIIYNQFYKDWQVVKYYYDAAGLADDKPNISMLAKWMPSCHSQSKNVRKLYRLFAEYSKLPAWLPMGERYYRTYLRKMRDYLDIVEKKIVNKDYESIDYTKIPSRALKRYTKLFNKYDYERFSSLMKKAANPTDNPEVKLNVKQLYPYEILGDVAFTYWRDRKVDFEDTDAKNAMWYQMPNFFKRDVSILPVLDTSGSMNGEPLKIAMSLAIYTAQNNSHDTFKNIVMQFSDNPHFVDIGKAHRLGDIVNCFHCDNGSTNFEGVMKKLLITAINNKLPKSEMPEYLLIISDMQFNSMSDMGYSFKPMEYSALTTPIPMMERLRKAYNNAGYDLPMMIYWNVADSPSKGRFPMAHLDGCIYISGKTPAIFDHLFDDKFPTTLDLINDIINSDRYKDITLKLD